MASEVDICSRALHLLGDESIVALTDDSDRARLCNRFYASTRDEVLRAHPWNFATKRASLAQLATAPVWEFNAAYQLPTDFLRIIDTDLGVNIPFRIEAKTLVTDASTAKITYIARITDPNQFDELFRDALEYNLASKIAFPITRDLSIARGMTELYLSKLSLAKTIDAKEGTPVAMEANDLLDVR